MTASRCPCGSGETFAECCAPLHCGDRAAATATALMRSRYSAFVMEDIAYLRATWHPSSRPATVATDATIQWRRLEIVAASGGGPFDDTGTVEFRAHYRRDGRPGALHERSVFVRENGRWFYADGTTD